MLASLLFNSGNEKIGFDHPSAQKYALVNGQSGFPTVIPRLRFAASRLRLGCSMIEAVKHNRGLPTAVSQGHWHEWPRNGMASQKVSCIHARHLHNHHSIHRNSSISLRCIEATNGSFDDRGPMKDPN